MVNLTRLQVSLHVAARELAPSVEALDAPLGTRRSLPAPGACYPALRCLPGRDSHPLDQCSARAIAHVGYGRSLEDAPLVDPTFLSDGWPPRFQQDPLSNRACGFPAHGLPVVSHVRALRDLRVPSSTPPTGRHSGGYVQIG